MFIIKRTATFVVDCVIVFLVAFMALVVYSMYTSDASMFNALTCHAQYDTDIEQTFCMFAKSN